MEYRDRIAPVHRPSVAYVDDVSEHALVSILHGFVMIDGRRTYLKKQQLELVTLLALEGRALHREEILAKVWPDAYPEKASGALRVAVKRLRERMGDSDAILTENPGYRLAPNFRVDLQEIEELERLIRRKGEHSPDLERRQWDALEDLVVWMVKRKPDWEWFTLIEQRIGELFRRIARHLSRETISPSEMNKLLVMGRRLVVCDPCDEFARELVVRAYLLQGDGAAALHEIEEYERFLEIEDGIRAPSPLREIVQSTV